MSTDDNKASVLKEIEHARRWLDTIEERIPTEEGINFIALDALSESTRNIVYVCGMLNGRYMERLSNL